MNQHTPAIRAADSIPASSKTNRVPAPQNRRAKKERDRIELGAESERSACDCTEFFEGITLRSAFDFVTDPLGEDSYEAGYCAFERASRNPFSI